MKKRSKTERHVKNSAHTKYMLRDEDTDDEFDKSNNNSYPSKESKRKYIILDEDIIEDSSAGYLIKNIYSNFSIKMLFVNVLFFILHILLLYFGFTKAIANIHPLIRNMIWKF